jgi:hypothetical protein
MECTHAPPLPEQLLYNVSSTGRSSGRFASFLAKNSMDDAIFVIQKSAIDTGAITTEEYDEGDSTLRAFAMRCFVPITLDSYVTQFSA